MWSPYLCSVLRKIASTAGFLCLIFLYIFIYAEIVEPFPSPTGVVNDFAGVIPIEAANRMSRISQAVLRPKNIIMRTGYGVEMILPDRLCGQILDQRVVPYFKKNDYDTGLVNAVAAVAQVIERGHRK